MTSTTQLTGELYTQMIRAGAANLREHVKLVNDLNVFPIPDGDTGDNMLLTIQGGANAVDENSLDLSDASSLVARGMLLGARGNSGVILSQFFDGIAAGFKGVTQADTATIGKAFKTGVDHAYDAVMEPTEGTILTVAKEATEYACGKAGITAESFISDFIEEAKRSLERTPELLAVLKKAGVVDSGGAGLIYIMEGMFRALSGDAIEDFIPERESKAETLNLDLFTEDSELEFGYCTELLVRLQNRKTDINSFSVDSFTEYLSGIGESIVAVRTDSIVKIHIHTMTPDKVLAYCQQFGEFLTVKIENMSLQHSNNNSPAADCDECEPGERRRYGIVAVASGDGVKQTFADLGADCLVDGGQSMNPSAEDFLRAFEKVNADTVLVFPNNGNIILAAKQAAQIYTDSDVRIIESKTIGDCYAALSMINTDTDDTDAIIAELNEAMEGVVTAEVSRSVRDSEAQNVSVHCGDYIGFIDKNILAACPERLEAACATADAAGICEHDICIIIRGVDSTESEAQALLEHIKKGNPFMEVYTIDGGQDIYSYILIAE